MALAALVGQSELKSRLGLILSGEPGHAYVLTGPAGIGKSTFAQAFAQALLCYQPTAQGACGNCESCRHFAHQAHPDFRKLLLDPKDKGIKVERVRQTIQADIALRPQFGRRKVYLIAADYLNEQGQNTLLKSLEEPPDFVTFILMASGPEKLLPTLLSRLTVLPLRRYQTDDVMQILRRDLTALDLPIPDPETLTFYARYANGLPGVALTLLSSAWFADLRQETIAFYHQLSRLTRAQVLTTGYAFFESNRTRADVILDILGTLTRDQLVLAVTGQTKYLTHPDLAQQFLLDGSDTTQTIPRLVRASAAIAAARRGLKLNASFEGLACHLMLTLRKELIHA